MLLIEQFIHVNQLPLVKTIILILFGITLKFMSCCTQRLLSVDAPSNWEIWTSVLRILDLSPGSSRVRSFHHDVL